MFWEPLDTTGAYTATRSFGALGPLTSFAVALDAERSLIIGPHKRVPEGADDELPPPAFLVAPNHYHNVGLAPTAERFPDALLCAASVAHPRLTKQTGLTFSDLDPVRAALPDHITLLEAPGTKNGEVLVQVVGDDATTWYTADAFFNFPPLPGLWGGFNRIAQNGPGLCLGNTFKYLGLRERSLYREWLVELLGTRRPTRLIPSHGAVLEGADLADQLIALTRRRL